MITLNKSDLIKVYRRDGFTLRLYDLGYDYRQNRSRLGYELKDHRKIIFRGNDYYPGSMVAIDSLKSVYILLSYLSLQAGDTDAEYFDSYTPEQLAWRDSNRAEELNWIAYTGLERLGAL